MYSIGMVHLRSRVAAAEESFLYADYASAERQIIDVLMNLVSLYSTGSSRLLTQPHHTCENGCVCQMAMILYLQCCYELNRSEDYIQHEIVETFYTKTEEMPYDVFLVWAELQVAYQRYKLCCQELIRYIDRHFSQTPMESFVASIPLRAPPTFPTSIDTALTTTNANTSHMTQTLITPHELELVNERYLQLMKLLIFDVLVPLGSYDEAIQFLKRGSGSKKHPRGSATTPQMQQCEQRISYEVRQNWIHQLQVLQTFHVTHAIDAIERAKQQSVLEYDQYAHGPSSPSSSPPSIAATGTEVVFRAANPNASEFHAGLATLDSTTLYQRYPPALMPPSEEMIDTEDEQNGANSTERACDDEKDGGDDEEEPSATSSRFTSIFSLGSKELIPFPTLQPIIPDPRSHAFVLSNYIRSLGHRLYAILYPRFPSLANRLRLISSWIWHRRSLITSVMIAYVAYRLLTLVVRYFRLAELPGVSLLIQELKNFIKIAFISGTGRSLFG